MDKRLITIHRALDRRFVPDYFVEWVVYHEMLHQKHAIPVINGRRRYHTQPFLDEENEFFYADIARRWEREYLNRLLVY